MHIFSKYNYNLQKEFCYIITRDGKIKLLLCKKNDIVFEQRCIRFSLGLSNILSLSQKCAEDSNLIDRNSSYK